MADNEVSLVSSLISGLPAIAGIIGLAFAVSELRQNRKFQAENAKLIRYSLAQGALIDILKEKEERDFFYRLDYEDWVFREDKFRGTSEERCLDSILHKVAFLGKLVREKAIELDDILMFEFIFRAIFVNSQVRDYIRWLQEEFPGDVSNDDGMALFLVIGRRKIKYLNKIGKLKEGDPLFPALEDVENNLLSHIIENRWWVSTSP